MSYQKVAAKAIPKVSFTVSNLEKAIAFYTQVLPFELENQFVWEGENINALFGLADKNLKIKVVQLTLKDEKIELMEFVTTIKGRMIPTDSKSNDLWFQHFAMVVRDMDKAYQSIKNKVNQISPEPQTLPDYLGPAADISAFYFKDPDGHILELIHLPPEKLDDEFKVEKGLFLGIDHTAIGVSDTAKSALLYKDIIGLKILGGSQNFGTEQENLTQVPDVNMDITLFGTGKGLGIESLEYLHPTNGREYPADSQPTDLWHWHITIQVNELDLIYQTIKKHNFRVISNGIVDLMENMEGKRGLLIRDMDGHAVLLVE